MAQDPAAQLAARHFEGLRDYLGPAYANKDSAALNNPQRQSARDKLTRLTKQQFLELATDVYDEMNRRVNDAATLPFLPVREDYHPKRNQARQKLATLQLARFKDLASDVFFEIERRFPHLGAPAPAPPKMGGSNPALAAAAAGGPADGGPGKAVPLATGSNLSLASSAAGGPPGPSNVTAARHPYGAAALPPPLATQGSVASVASSNAAGVNFSNLDSLMADLGNMLESSGGPDERSGAAVAAAGVAADDSGDARLVALQRRIHELEDQLADRDKRLLATRDAQQQLQTLQAAHDKLQEAFGDMKRQRDDLQDDLSNQERMASDVRREARTLFEEAQGLKARLEEATGERDRLAAENQALQRRLAAPGAVAAAAVAATAVATSQPAARRLSHASGRSDTGSATARHPRGRHPNIDVQRDHVRVAPDGVVDMSRLAAYQSAADDLLKASRSDAPTSVLVAMKCIVIACKNMTEDIEAYEAGPAALSSDARDELAATKNRISGALKTLMEAAKAHASAFTNQGANSPACQAADSELRSALVSLSDAICDILHIVRVRGVSAAAVAAPAPTPAAEPVPVYDIDELKAFLERQTDAIVQAIQVLLQGMRSQSTALPPDFTSTVATITSIVDKLVQIATQTLAAPAAAQFRGQGSAILARLTSANRQLEELGHSIASSPGSKSIKQNLASASYDIAKHVKELISLIE